VPTTECRNSSTGANETIGTKAWTTADSAICFTLNAGQCRDSATKLAISFADDKTGWKSSTDAECTISDNHECRNSSSNVIEPIGANAWTSVNSAICNVVASNKCRDSSTKLAISFTDDKTGWKSGNDSECTIISNTECRNSSTGANEAIGTKAWTSADS